MKGAGASPPRSETNTQTAVSKRKKFHQSKTPPLADAIRECRPKSRGRLIEQLRSAARESGSHRRRSDFRAELPGEDRISKIRAFALERESIRSPDTNLSSIGR